MSEPKKTELVPETKRSARSMGWNPKSSPEKRWKMRERRRAKEVEPQKELKKEKRSGSVRQCGLVKKLERIIIVGVVLETQRN